MVKGNAPSSKKTHYRDLPGGLGHIPEESFKHGFEERMPKTDGEDLRIQASTPGVMHVLEMDKGGVIHRPIEDPEAFVEDNNYHLAVPEQRANSPRPYQLGWSDAPDSTLYHTHGQGRTTRLWRSQLPQSRIDTGGMRFYNSAQSPSDSERTLSSADSSGSHLTTPWSTYCSQVGIFNQDQGFQHMEFPTASQAQASHSVCQPWPHEHQIQSRPYPQFTPQPSLPFLPTAQGDLSHQEINELSSVTSGGQPIAQYTAEATLSMPDSSMPFNYGGFSTNDYLSDIPYASSSTNLYELQGQRGVEFEHYYSNT